MCRLTRELDIKGTELRLLQERCAGSESAQLAEAAAASERELAEATAAAEGARRHKADMAASAKVLFHPDDSLLLIQMGMCFNGH